MTENRFGVNAPPFNGGRKIDGFCVVVNDVWASMKKYHKTLGWGPWKLWHAKPPNLSNTTFRGKEVHHTFEFAAAQVGPLVFELIQPVEGPSSYQEFLEEKGEGLQHMQAHFTDIKVVKGLLEEYDKAGIKVVQTGKFCGNEYFYLDTEPSLGSIFELLKVGDMISPDATYP